MSEEQHPYVGALPPQFPGNLKDGSTGNSVKLMQEFLSLAGFELVLDGDFGPATARALQKFSIEKLGQGSATKELTRAVWQSLTDNMRLALTRIPKSKYPNDLAVAYAKQHLAAGARELLSKNMGPWVRMYTNGHEGQEWAWCAGFISFIIKQVVETYDLNYLEADVPKTLSVDQIAKWGANHNKLMTVLTPTTKIFPGAIFMIYRGGQDWIHTGLVSSFKDGVLETIEGNSNEAGSREGTCVIRRYRPINKNIHIVYDWFPKVIV